MAALQEEQTAATDTSSTGGGTTSGNSGPPMSAGEKDALRVAVGKFWNIGLAFHRCLADDRDACRFRCARTARPIRPRSAWSVSQAALKRAARQAFEAAKRAIMRSGQRRFPAAA